MISCASQAIQVEDLEPVNSLIVFKLGRDANVGKGPGRTSKGISCMRNGPKERYLLDKIS